MKNPQRYGSGQKCQGGNFYLQQKQDQLVVGSFWGPSFFEPEKSGWNIKLLRFWARLIKENNRK